MKRILAMFAAMLFMVTVASAVELSFGPNDEVIFTAPEYQIEVAGDGKTITARLKAQGGAWDVALSPPTMLELITGEFVADDPANETVPDAPGTYCASFRATSGGEGIAKMAFTYKKDGAVFATVNVYLWMNDDNQIAVLDSAYTEGTPALETEDYSVALSDDGYSLNVKLRANATTGYAWQMVQLPINAFTGKDSEYVVDDAAEGAVGVGGQQVFTHTATMDNSGWCALMYTYARDWESESADTTEYHILVWVDESGAMEIGDIFTWKNG